MHILIILFLLFYILFFSYLIYIELHNDRKFTNKINICQNPIVTTIKPDVIEENKEIIDPDQNQIFKIKQEQYILTQKKNPKLYILFLSGGDNDTIEEILDLDPIKKYYDFNLYQSKSEILNVLVIQKFHDMISNLINDEEYIIIVNDKELIIDVIITYYHNARSIYNRNLKVIGVKNKYYGRIFKNFRSFLPVKFQLRRKVYKLDKYFYFSLV